MIKLGLVGRSISHSRSQEVYEDILSQKIDYTLFDFPNENDIFELPLLFEKVQGISITSPYKKHFMSKVKMELEIKNLGAINCIRFDGESFFATNTDYLAASKIITGQLDHFKKIEWYILGDGSMASVFKKILERNGQHYLQYSRKEHGQLEDLNIVSQKNISPLFVINTCSRDYIFKGKMPQGSVFWDCNYNMPVHQNFFQKSRIDYHDGMELLRLQASYALSFWGISIPGSDLNK